MANKKSHTANAINANSISSFLQSAASSAASGNAYSRGQGNSFSAVDVANMKWEQLQFEQEALLNEEWWNERESIQGLKSQYEEAGFNPMLAATGGAVQGSGSVSTPDAPGAVDTPTEGTNPLGFIGQLLGLFQGFGGLVNNLRDTQSAINLRSEQGKAAQASAARDASEAHNLDEDTRSKQIYNNYADDLYKRSLSKSDAEIAKLKSDIDLNVADIALKEQGVKESLAREALAYAQEAKERWNAEQIRSLIPYQISLMQAQTASEKAKAQLDFMVAMKEKGMIEAGVCDAYVSNLRSQTSVNESQVDLNNSAADSNRAQANKWNADAEVVKATKTAAVANAWISSITGGIKNLTSAAADVGSLMIPGGPIVKKVSETFTSHTPRPDGGWVQESSTIN